MKLCLVRGGRVIVCWPGIMDVDESLSCSGRASSMLVGYEFLGSVEVILSSQTQNSLS